MGLFTKIKDAVSPNWPADPDVCEWDADGSTGDDSAYDGLAAESVIYDPAEFDTETEDDGEVIELGEHDEVS